MNPKISVIIPVYKAEKYIEDTVKSVLAQVFTDFEIVLVDDGSPDSCPEICDALAAGDKRIRVIHKSNGGVSSARNAGLEAAIGDYIAWVDSDDVISPIMLSVLYNMVIRSDADFAQCMHTREVDSLTVEKNYDDIDVEILNNVDCLKRIYTTNYTNSCSLCSKLIRRQLFWGLRFPEGRVFEDDEIVPRLMAKAKCGAFCEENLYCYIKRENSIITGSNENSLIALTNTLIDRMKFFKTIDNCLYDMCLKHTLHYLKVKVCHEGGKVKSLCVDYLKSYKKEFLSVANKYDKIYLRLIFIKAFENWITKNDFEPIQKIIGKIKR